ncbi:MAG: GTP cyclohydrolase I FolE [Chloroflexi bacterium]|nr:GTP cyclohydrolase I FolE [Chloroflexota bacterium]
MEFNEDLDDIEVTPTNVEVNIVQGLVYDMIKALGENPEREGLKNTPHRVSRMFTELLSGYAMDPQKVINGALFNITYDEMVIVRDIEFYSLCEHHMLPFLGRAHVAYLPAGKVIGLSKIPRIVDMYARRLQVQERMTRQIADFLQKTLQPQGVAVVVEAIHLCSMMRGVKKHDARMTTSAMHGAFRANLATRQEFLDNISRGAKPLQF